MTEKLNINDLTDLMNKFVEAKGWYKDDTTKEQTPKNIALSLILESAEVLEHFQWTSEITDIKGLASELADVQLYLLQLASICKIDLEKAVLEKLELNYSRTW